VLKLNDQQLQALMAVASRLPSEKRDAFLRRVGVLLQGRSLDDETGIFATILNTAHAFTERERGSLPRMIARGNKRSRYPA
jgi:hypothetical protein